MTIRPGLRFKVFQDDGFICSYCGRRPPEVVLEVDHIIPSSRGGSDDRDNLQTSCRECNQAKSSSIVVLGEWDPQTRLQSNEWGHFSIRDTLILVFGPYPRFTRLFDDELLQSFIDRGMYSATIQTMVYRTKIWCEENDQGGACWEVIWEHFVRLCEAKCTEIEECPDQGWRHFTAAGA